MATKINTELIENYRKEHNLTIKEFCKKCGITQTSYYKLMRNELNIRITTYVKILNAMNVYSDEMLNVED